MGRWTSISAVTVWNYGNRIKSWKGVRVATVTSKKDGQLDSWSKYTNQFWLRAKWIEHIFLFYTICISLGLCQDRNIQYQSNNWQIWCQRQTIWLGSRNNSLDFSENINLIKPIEIGIVCIFSFKEWLHLRSKHTINHRTVLSKCFHSERKKRNRWDQWKYKHMFTQLRRPVKSNKPYTKLLVILKSK